MNCGHMQTSRLKSSIIILSKQEGKVTNIYLVTDCWDLSPAILNKYANGKPVSIKLLFTYNYETMAWDYKGLKYEKVYFVFK
jgi:hypothetical protein